MHESSSDTRENYYGTSLTPECLNHKDDIGIATGNWGCGAFGGDPQVKSIIQWLAASQVPSKCLYESTFSLLESTLAYLENDHRFINNEYISVGMRPFGEAQSKDTRACALTPLDNQVYVFQALRPFVVYYTFGTEALQNLEKVRYPSINRNE